MRNVHRSDNTETVLACSHGFAVKAANRHLGTVETPIFSGTRLRPDSLLIRPAGSPPAAGKIVSVAFVIDVDPTRQEIVLDGDGESVLVADGS